MNINDMVSVAERIGLLDPIKKNSGAPLHYRFLNKEEFEAAKKAGVEVIDRVDVVVGPAYDGFGPPEIRQAIDLYYRSSYAETIPLSDFLIRMFDDDDSQ